MVYESVLRRNRACRLFAALLGVLSLLCITACAQADVWDDWDYPGQKRKIKIWVKGAGGIPGFAAAVQAAMDNWNGSSGDPPKDNNGDWELVPGTEADHDVAVGGGKMDGAGGTLGDTAVSYDAGTGEAVGDVDITIDNEENYGPGADQQDLERTIKHELGHAQRMDDTDMAGDLMNGSQAAGNHNVTPSGHDQSEARASFWDNVPVDVLPEKFRQGVPTMCSITGPMNLALAQSVVVTPLDPTHLQVLGTDWNESQVFAQFLAVPETRESAGAWHNEGFTINITYQNGNMATFGSFVTTNPVDPPAELLPHAVAGPDVVIPAGQIFTLDGSGSFHGDPAYTSSLVHIWRRDSGPGQTTAVQTEMLSMSISTPGIYTFTLEVEDLFAQKSTDEVTVEVFAVPPVNVAISPSQGTLGTTPFTLSSLYSDANGFADVRFCYLLLNDSLAQANAAMLMYDRLANRLYLKNDANTSWGTGYAPGTAVLLENSQCFVRVGETSVAGVGNDLTVNWRIALKDPFTSKLLNAYMYVRDGGGLTDGWDKVGFYYNVKPQVLGIDPTGTLPIDSFFTINSHYTDLNGYLDVRKCYLLINDKFDQKNAVFIWYDKLSNKVYLKNDDNTSWGIGYGLTTPVILSNSQCEVDVGNTHITVGGPDLTVNWFIKLKTTMVYKSLCSWMYITDSKGAFDGWRKVGIHFTPIAPVCLFLGPSSGTVGTGSEQIFTTIYSDDNGYEDIHRAYFQLSVTSSQANAVLLMYDAKQNKVYLKNDANNSWGTGFAPGSANILQNSQCSVDLSTMLTPNGVTDTQLEIFWPIVLKASQSGKKLQERMYVIDNEGLASGWKYKGTVTAL